MDVVISEPVFIRLFRNSLQLSIHAQAKQDGRQKNSWKQAIKKTITMEGKAAFNLPSWVWKIDTRCPWSHQSSTKTDKRTKEKVFKQNSSRSQEPRNQPPLRSKNTITSDQPLKDHKNNRHNRKCHRDCGPHSPRPPGSTPATGVNKTNSLAWNDRKCNWPLKREDRDLTQVIYYNCNKKRHFANQYTEFHKPKN